LRGGVNIRYFGSNGKYNERKWTKGGGDREPQYKEESCGA